MNILLDTHIALWALAGDPVLPVQGEKLICDKSNRIFFSIASMWEVSIKHTIKPGRMPITGAEFLHYCEQAGYERLSIHERHVLALELLESIHADPIDRILVVQAHTEGFLLLTHDKTLASYGDMFWLCSLHKKSPTNTSPGQGLKRKVGPASF